ncbi:4Fe-4S dicluster domain-containing protein [Crassaminicella thermophila]|uniref:4Fe-4S dicluster domain-containing protein n=1 Tax=Crassaminicella thermophila TaxID=2599308 RepID=A0A5C0SEK9_CRATE|nr:NIL domain-containing protein [Crassaminicella thermophila]QEK12873.1 4Fe-4S dicluster domain-containing protein [Crassaminicella thermophila]
MKKKIFLIFPPHLTDQPITYTLIKKYDLKTNILRASINYNTQGNLLLELEGTKENISSGIRYLENIGVKVDFIHTEIKWDEKACIHCGACTAVCPSDALKLDSNSWLLSFNAEECLGCKLCIKACPLKIITNGL